MLNLITKENVSNTENIIIKDYNDFISENKDQQMTLSHFKKNIILTRLTTIIFLNKSPLENEVFSLVLIYLSYMSDFYDIDNMIESIKDNSKYYSLSDIDTHIFAEAIIISVFKRDLIFKELLQLFYNSSN